MSGPSEILSEGEQTKDNFFRSMDMMVPTTSRRKGNFCSTERRRHSSASTSVAYNCFSSTAPESVCAASVDSLSLPHSASLVTVPVFIETASAKSWWTRGDVNRSNVSCHRSSGTISQLHQGGLKMPVRSLSYPFLTTYPTIKSEKQGMQQHECELESEQVGGRSSGTRCRVVSRSVCSSFCNNTAKMRQSEQQQRQEQEDGDEEEEELQQEEEEARQQRDEHETTVQQQLQLMAPYEKKEAKYQEDASAEKLSSENCRGSILNSSNPGSFTNRCWKEEVAISRREGSRRRGNVACRKGRLSDVGRNVAITAVTLPRKELRWTVSLANKREALASLGVPSTMRHTAQQRLIAAVAFLSADGATPGPAEEATTPGASNAEEPLARFEAITAPERHEETRSTGPTQEATRPVPQLAAAGRNRGEVPAGNAAGEGYTIDAGTPSYEQVSVSATTALDSEAENKRCNMSPPRVKGMWKRQPCDRAVQDRSEAPPSIAADIVCNSDNVSFSENGAGSSQRAVVTWNAPIVRSPAPEGTAEMRDVHLIAKEGSGPGIPGPSGWLSRCSRSATSSVSGFPSALTSGSDIPTIRLCTAQDTDDGGESRGISALSRKQQTIPTTIIQGSESTMEVSVGSPDDRWRPVPNIVFCGANATEDDDLPPTSSDVFRGSEARGSSAETRLLTRPTPLSPRSSGELPSATENRGEGLYDGNDIKKTAGSAGATPLMYGRYLGVVDLSAGQGIASPSTLSTASPCSCSGFSSSYSLPSSSTPVLGSQLDTSAAASMISPSPAGTFAEDAFLTASSSPSVFALGTAGGEGSAFTPSSVEDSLSHSSSPCLSPAPSDDDSAAIPSVTATATARSWVTNEAVGEAAGRSPVDAAQSAGASVLGSIGSGRCEAVSVAPALDSLASAAAPAGRGNPVGNEIDATVAVGDNAEPRQFIDRIGAIILKAPVSASAVVRGTRAPSIARGSPRETNEDVISMIAGPTNNSTSEGEQKEGGRQKSTWKLFMRKMFSSKSLLRWKTAIGAIATKQQAGVQATMNPDSTSATGHQQLPQGKNVSADNHAVLHHRDATSIIAAAGRVSMPRSTPVRSHAAAGTRARYTTEGPPSENRAISVETSSILQRTSNPADRKGSTGSEERLSLLCSSPIAQDVGKLQEAQVTSRQEGRHDEQDALQQKDGQPPAVSFNSPLDAQHVWQHETFIPKQQALLQQHQEEDRWKAYNCRKELQIEHCGMNCESEEGGIQGSRESGLGKRRNELIYQWERENDFSADGGWIPVSHFHDKQQLNSCENKLVEDQSQQLEEEQAVRSKQLRDTQVSSSRMLQSQGEHHHWVPQEAEDWLFRSNVQKQQKARGEQQLLGEEQHQEHQWEESSICRQGRKGGCGHLPAEQQRDTDQREPRKTDRQCAMERLQKELPGKRKQLQPKAVLQQSRTQPLSESLDVLQRSGWMRKQEDQVVWMQDPEVQHLAESAMFVVEGGRVFPIGRSPCGSRRETLPGNEGSSSPWKGNLNFPVLSRSLSSPLSLSPSSSTGGSASPTPAIEDPSLFSGVVFPLGRRSSCRRHGGARAPAGTSAACTMFCGMHSSSATSPVVGDTDRAVRPTVAARAVHTAVSGAALCTPERPVNSAAWNRTAAAEARKSRGRQKAPEGETGRLARSQSFYAAWRDPGTRQVSCDGDTRRMFTWSAASEDFSQSCASHSALTPSHRVQAGAQTSDKQPSGYGMPDRGPEHASDLAFSKETLLCLDVNSGVDSSESHRSEQTFLEDQQRFMTASQEERTLYITSLSKLSASASAGTEASTTTGPRDCRTVELGMDAEHLVVQEEDRCLTAPALPHEVTTHTAVTAAPTTTAANGFFHWRETPEVGNCPASPSILRGPRGRSASAASVVGAVQPPGVISTDGTRPPARPQAAGLDGGATPEKNSLKREKELRALAFIKDHLNASAPHSQRRGLRGGRSRRCGCSRADFENNVCGRGDECVAHRVSASLGLLCSPSEMRLPDPAADESPHIEAAAEGGAPSSSGEVHVLKQRGAIHRVATLGTPADFYLQRSALHTCPNRRSWPQLPAASAVGTTQRDGLVEQAQVASEFPNSFSTDELEKIHEQPSSSRTETRLQHHLRRLLHLWADGEQIQRSDSSGSLESETAAPCDGGGKERQQQQQQSRATRHTVDGGGQRIISLRHCGPVAVSDPVYVQRRSVERRTAAKDNSPRSCGLLSLPANVHGRCVCYRDGSDASRRRLSSSGRHRSISLHATAHGRSQSGHYVTLRQCKSEKSFHPATPAQVRECVEDTRTNLAAAEGPSVLSFSHSARASAAGVVIPASSRVGGCGLSTFPTSAERRDAAIDSEMWAAAAAESASKDAPALPEETGHNYGRNLAGGSTVICPDWKVEDDDAFDYAVSPSDSTTRTLPRQSEAAARRSNTAVLRTGAASGTAYAAALTGSVPRAPVATSAEAIFRRKEAVLTSSDPAKAVALAEDMASGRRQPRLRVQECRLLEQLQTPQDKNKPRQRQRWQTEDDCQDGKQNMQKRNRLDDDQCWQWRPEQQQWSAWQDQRLAVIGGNGGADGTNLGEPETPLSQQERHAKLQASLSPRAPASPVFGAAGLQSFLVFPRKETEESYRQQLSSVFSIRLRVVGVALVFLHILHLVWGIVRTATHLQQRNVLESRIAAAGDAAQLGLYAALCLGSRIHRNKVSLETWTCALFSIAFAARFCALIATLFSGRAASQFFAAENISATADNGLLASYISAVSYQLVRLSLCCIFHVLICGMMLPARTLICLPMHAFHFGGCLIATGAAATCTHLNLDPDGPVCALSSCLYTVLGFICQAQLEASQRQLYVRWKDSQKGLQDMRRRRKQRSLSSADLTGVEQVAMLVRQSQMLLREVVDGGNTHSREGLFEQLASLQKEILEIVTDVRSMYNEQKGKGEIYELLNFVPEGQVVEPPVPTKVCQQEETYPCRQLTCIDRCWWRWQQSGCLLPERAQTGTRGQDGALMSHFSASEAPAAVAGPRGAGKLKAPAAAIAAVQLAPATARGLAGEEGQLSTKAHREGSSGSTVLGECVDAIGERGGDHDRSCQFLRPLGINCSYTQLFEADLEEWSVVRETVEKMQRAASNRKEDIVQEPASAAVELIRRLGIEWDVDFFELDEYTEGNTLRLTGEVQLSPLVRPDGLRCEMRVLRRFLHCLQRQYRKTNPYHNQLHAAMVSHCCQVLVGECLPSRDALTYNDEICLCVAALAHDIGHPGLTNQYLINCQSLLATTYNDIAVLENYHAACCFRTASHCEDLNIFGGLSKDTYAYIRQNIIGLILATDMSKHISYISRLRVRSEAGNFNPATSADRWLFFQACMKAADLAHTATSWGQHKRWSELLCEEFYRQGDEERRQGLPVVETFDRTMAFRFPQSQYRFMCVVVEPLLEAIMDVEALLQGRGGVRTVICRHVEYNRRRWRRLAIAAGVGSPAEKEGDTEDEHEIINTEENQKGEQQRTLGKNEVYAAGER